MNTVRSGPSPEGLSMIEERRNTFTATSQPPEEIRFYKCSFIFTGFIAKFQVIAINNVVQEKSATKDSLIPRRTPTPPIAFIGTFEG